MESWFAKLLLNYPFLPVYLIAVMMALWRYPRYYDTAMRYFPVLLMYTLATETLGVLIREFDEISIFLNEQFLNYNWLIYNIYTLVFNFFFYTVYYLALSGRKTRQFLLAGALFFGLVSLINPMLQSFTYEIQLWSYLSGGVVLITAALLYLLHRRKRSGQLFSDRDLLSWVSLGLFVFYLGFLPIAMIRHYNGLYQLPDPRGLIITLQGLIFFMYGCFIAGFWRMRSLRVFLNQ